MIKVNIFYPDKEGSRLDLDYYLKVHMPAAREKLRPSLRGVSVEYGLSGVQRGTKRTSIAMCNYTFASAEAFLEAFLPQAAFLQGDMPNYTAREPVMQFSEIKLSQE